MPLAFTQEDFLVFLVLSVTTRAFKTLIEPYNNATSCTDQVLNYSATSRLDMVLIIPSRNNVDTVRRRQAIRRTWGNDTKHLPLVTRHVFILGTNVYAHLTLLKSISHRFFKDKFWINWTN